MPDPPDSENPSNPDTLATTLGGLGKIVEDSLNEIYVFDADTLKFILINRGARENLGFGMMALKGMTPVDIKPLIDAEGFEELITPLRESEVDILQFETVHQRQDGSQYDVDIHLQLSELAGDPVFVAIVLDVTQRNQERAQLEERGARMNAILNNAVDAIITISERGIIDSINPATERLFGYTAGELIGENVKILMPSPYQEEHDGYLENYHRTGERKIIGSGREVTGRRRDGSTFPMHLAVSEVTVGDKKFYSGIVRDISEIKQAEAELKSINDHLEELVEARTKALESAQEKLLRTERLATLGQLSGGVAHELRSPLGVIRNAAMFLEEYRDAPEEDIEDSFAEIRRSLEKSDKIIADLLDFARDPTSDATVFKLQDAIDSSFEGLELPTNIEVQPPPDELEISCHGDPRQVSQILTNLMSNAIQAMPDGGSLILMVSAEGEAAAIEVRDTGIGMSDEQIEKIFEPLYTSKVKGIGLGLPISERYARLNQGTLEVKSELGKGSTFRLTLPIGKS